MKYKKSAVVRVSVGMGAAALSVVASMPLRGVPIEAASSPPPSSRSSMRRGRSSSMQPNLGGDQFDEGNGIVVDQSGSAYVTGYTATYGSRFPGTADSPIQSTPGGGFDAFVAKVITNTGPICSAAKAVPHILWNPNHRLVPVAVHGVTDPDGNPVSITVIGVTQDEPVHTERHGHTRPDAVIQAGSASVRAERLGSGNGRVYEITFKTDDGQGGFCTGAVKVSVPHSLRRGATAIDDGQIYDSTVP